MIDSCTGPSLLTLVPTLPYPESLPTYLLKIYLLPHKAGVSVQSDGTLVGRYLWRPVELEGSGGSGGI